MEKRITPAARILIVTMTVFLLLLCGEVIMTPSSHAAEGDITIDASTFPDEHFRNWVIMNVTKGSTTLTQAEIDATTSMDINSQYIADLTGIEYFTALTDLNCYGNSLTSLDMSTNPALTTLDCSLNSLTTLNVKANTKLTDLNCGYNSLSDLDVEANTALTKLHCYFNQLTSLDVKTNTGLMDLSCYNNQLTALDLTANTALTNVSCYNNKLTALDLTNATALTTLYCYSNNLTALDLSKNTQLNSFLGHDQTYSALPVTGSSANWQVDLKALTCLNMANVTLDAGQGATLDPTTGIVTFDATIADRPTTLKYTYATGNTVYDSAKTIPVTVNLKEPTPVTGVTLNKTTLDLIAGGEETLTATVAPADATNKNVTWASSDTTVATVAGGKITALKSGSTTITVTTEDGAKTATCAVTVSDAKPVINYTVHGQNYGWSQGYKSDGSTAGTTGQGLRIEAIKANVTDVDGKAITGLGVSYNTHLENIGWQKNGASDDGVSGTTGESRQIEALRMKLTGDKSDAYDIYYRVQIKNLGWLNWAVNGEDATFAGTTGYNLRVEAIQAVIVKKGDPAPELNPVSDTDITQSVAENVLYTAHIQNVGWNQGEQRSNQFETGTAGTVGQSLRMEAIKIKDNNANLNLTYRVHVQNEGWMLWVPEGSIAGTTGRGLRMEAFELKATGSDADKYAISYRVMVQDKGWTNWVTNGDIAGTTGQGLRIEAIQIRVVENN